MGIRSLEPRPLPGPRPVLCQPGAKPWVTARSNAEGYRPDSRYPRTSDSGHQAWRFSLTTPPRARRNFGCSKMTTARPPRASCSTPSPSSATWNSCRNSPGPSRRSDTHRLAPAGPRPRLHLLLGLGLQGHPRCLRARLPRPGDARASARRRRSADHLACAASPRKGPVLLPLLRQPRAQLPLWLPRLRRRHHRPLPPARAPLLQLTRTERTKARQPAGLLFRGSRPNA
jgi:hypothetical protein